MSDRKGTFKSPNFLHMADIFNLVDSLGWDTVFALLAFISFLFSHRVPSEVLPPRRDFRDDTIGGSS